MAMKCQLWMGSLEPYMTEAFLLAAFRKMGEDPLNVKLMRNKYTGEPAGYGFVSFVSDEAAMNAMHKLNSKPIPGSSPTVRFRLNSATNNASKSLLNDREFSVWVGDLSSDVDDYNLYRVFSAKYTSIKTAKVIQDSSGFSKGYGFVKFGLEEEQQDALYKMNGFVGLGSKPLKICNAVPKPKDPSAVSGVVTSTYGADYSQYYDPNTFWQYSTSWQNYYDQSSQDTSYYNQPAAVAAAAAAAAATTTTTTVDYAHYSSYNQEDDELALVEHKIPVDVDKINSETIERDCNLWDALERSKWLPIEQLEIKT